MSTHIESKLEDISSVVLMPGDPKRCEYIARKFLANSKIVNNVRGMTAYTGFYKSKKITVFPSGMGCPSMGIYSYELFKFYDVELILRIGSCGAYDDKLKIGDILLVNSSYSEGNFSKNLTSEENHLSYPDKNLTDEIEEFSKNKNINIKRANTACSECFEGYTPDIHAFSNRFPTHLNIKASEMEAFALFETAKLLNKKSACLLTVADIIGKEAMDITDREKALNAMIELALDFLSLKK